MDQLEQIPLIICLPFALLLMAIALLPILIPKFWESNLNKAIIVTLISLPVLVYFILNQPGELGRVLNEYLAFILLLAALFIIAGGVLITGNLKATPLVNTLILFSGAVLANLVGTTGASMLLIRPLLQSLCERKKIHHIPIFFIIIVSNVGGLLTPLGDPPLFLGYLRGVPFTWTLTLFPIWITTLGLLLVVFYIWDNICFRKETVKTLLNDQTLTAPIKISGKINLLFLALVVLSILFQMPAPYRELLMVLTIALSLIFTSKDLRCQNKFTFSPIIEVAVLFVGIFITMAPFMELLRLKGAALGITKPWQFFWLTGGLSSFLDNAPTYLTFSSLAESVTSGLSNTTIPVVANIRADLLAAISCGAVLMGANTYIGNGPNFMVRAIVEENGVKMPHFLGYIFYSSIILVPVFLILTWLFFI